MKIQALIEKWRERQRYWEKIAEEAKRFAKSFKSGADRRENGGKAYA